MPLDRDDQPGDGMAFADIGEIEQALARGIITHHSKIHTRIETVDSDGKTKIIRLETTAGRV